VKPPAFKLHEKIPVTDRSFRPAKRIGVRAAR
jgi:hypothetical protein